MYSFTVYKIRTMVKDAESMSPKEIEVWNKPINDSRIIMWGKILRKTWIDELPQLYNILKWEMRIFGHRPITEIDRKNLKTKQNNRMDKSTPGILWGYAFANKWKEIRVKGWWKKRNRTIKEDQDLYLIFRHKAEKLGTLRKYHLWV